MFVHGISENRVSTWTKGDVFWPESLLARDVPHARILTAGYSPTVESFDIEHELLKSTIESHAADICDKLGRLRDDTKTVRMKFYDLNQENPDLKRGCHLYLSEKFFFL